MKTLKDLFLDSLADIYYAENQLVKALPKMAKAATDDQLQEAFESHLEETKGHVTKVESVFGEFGQKARSKKCPAIVGLTDEADEMASENKGSPAIDAALIAAGQKVEHYEIATYGSLKEWAQVLGEDVAADTLEEILEEEKAADAALSELARSHCNAAANQPNESGDVQEEESESELGHGRSTASREATRRRAA
jgi:ferritin-like metal-binding protein YciE